MLFNKNELLKALESQLIANNLEEISINEIIIDSRKAATNKLFFALKGENNDGHNFIEQVFENGCEAALISDLAIFEKYKNKNLILVKDTFASLYELAKFSRQRSRAKIMAVTGSVGKTGTKEMLRSAFLNQGKTYATSGNLNNHFGLPLTLCNVPRDCEFVILEMGMNHLNEIAPLTKLARPDIAIITNVTSAHIGNFNNEEEIALAKSEIFLGLDNKGIALINQDNIHYDFLKNKALSYKIKEENILSFGKNIKSTYQLESIEIKSAELSAITIKTKNHSSFSYEISSSHQATIFNSLIIVACLDLLVSDLKSSLESLKKIEAAKGRGNVFDLKIDNKNITIIDDSYNANIASMKTGIQYLSDLKNILNKKRSMAILGDMFELGDKAPQIHQEVLKFLEEKNIDFAILAGDEMKNATKTLDKQNYKAYLNSNEISLDIKNLIQDGDILLIKGSRGMKMEETIKKLL